MMRSFVTFACLLALAAPNLARAEMSESDRKNACMGDAFKLCSSAIPDRRAVRRCMGEKRDQLSPDCRIAFDGGDAGTRARR